MSVKTQPRVLIVDDDQDMLLIMETVFESAGARVTKTSMPLEGLNMAKASLTLGEPFSLVVLDIRMPDIDGHALAQQMREAGFKGPIVAFTAYASGEGRAKGREVGITHYLSKTQLKREVITALLQQCS